MKRLLLFVFLVAMVYPCMSQNVNSGREKKHSSLISLFKDLTGKKIPERKELRFDFDEVGIMYLRNNAHADSMLAYINLDKSEMWEFSSKKIPVYYEGTNLIKELEIWYTDIWKNEFAYGIKLAAEYDENERMTRLETYYWEDDQWIPDFAEEMLVDHLGDELFYAEYYYSVDDEDWVMIYGFRANDEFDENDLLIRRIWEYYYDNDWKSGWYPDWMEEFSYNENDVVIEIIEYYYNDWDGIWENDYRMTFTVDEDNTWDSGYSYYWDWDEEVWVPSLKYIDVEWFNFDLMQYTTLTILMNADDWDDWKDNGNKDITWINYMRNTADYSPTGLMKSMMIEVWDSEFKDDWTPVFKMEWDYDHFDNIIYDVTSVYEGMNWMIIYGFKLDVEYNEDQSIKSIVHSVTDDFWKGEFIPFNMYEFYYTDDETGISDTVTPEALKIYPNPTASDLHFMWTGGNEYVDILIIGMDGKIIRQLEKYPVKTGETFSLDVSQLQTGVYLVRVKGNKDFQVGRFMKK